MKVLYLHKYNVENRVSENISKYNAPHKYRVYSDFMQTEKIDLPTGKREIENCLNLFRDGLPELEIEIVDKIKQGLREDLFLFAFPYTKPANKIFNDELQTIIKRNFIDAIDISACFFKKKELNSTKLKRKLSDEALSEYYGIDKAKLENLIKGKQISTLLLIDDVYSNGNTFTSMELAFKEITHDFLVIGAVILKMPDDATTRFSLPAKHKQ